MANNIGIKVDVAFPSASELQRKLELEWERVKGELEAGVKVKINKTSLTELKTSVRNALNEDVYEIDVSTKSAVEGLNKMYKVIEKIDKELKKERKLKVNLDVVNLQSSLKDLLGSMEKVQKESKNSLSEGMKGFSDEIKNADKNLASLTRRYKLNKDGGITSIVTGQTKKDSLGASEKVTFKETSKGMTADVEYLHNKETAIKSVEKALKDLYDLEVKMQNASQNGDKGSYERYKKQHDKQADDVVGVKKDYEDRYGESATASESIKHLQEKHTLNREILALKKQHKDELEAERQAQRKIAEEQAKAKKEMSEYESAINSAFNEYLKYTKDIHSTNEKIKNATGEHKAELKGEVAFYQQKREEIDKEHDLLSLLNKEQRKQIGDLEEKLKIQSKVKDAQKEEAKRVEAISEHMSDYEKKINSAFSEYKESMRAVNDLQSKLEKATGDHRAELQKQINLHEENLENLNKEHNLIKNISDEQVRELVRLKDKLSHSSKLKSLQEQEEKRIKAISDKMSEYEKTINRTFNSYVDSLKESSRLHKEIEKATGYHKEELQSQIKYYELKRQKIEKEHNLLENINDVQKEELSTLKEKLRHSEKLKEAKDFEKELAEEVNRELKKQKQILDDAFDLYVKNRKEMHNVYSEMRKATGDHKKALEKQLALLTKRRDKLESEHDLLNAISDEQRQQLSDLKSRLIYEEKIRSAKDKEHEELRNIQEATSKLVSMEKERFRLQKELMKATESQKNGIRESIAFYDRIIQQTRDKVKFDEKASDKQKEALNNLRELNDIQIRMVRAQQEENAMNEREKSILMANKSIRKEILDIEEKIARLEALRGKDGVEAKIQSLKHALAIAKEEETVLNEQVQSEEKIKNAINEQNQLLQRAHSLRMRQIDADNEISSNQQKANDLLRNYQDTLRRIGSLQRDLVFAGDRESNVISVAIRLERQKLEAMREQLRTSSLISDERKQEIARIEQAQNEQLRLNRLRQNEREVDRVHDNAYGVTDIRSYVMDMSQGFRAVLHGVAEIDEAFMRVKKVAESTDEDLKRFKDTSYDVASGLGVTATAYMQAVEKWVTAGYTLEQSEEFGQISTIGSFVGNIETDLMAKWLSVPLNTFQSDLVDANDIINVMNETSNNHAIEMEELGKAYMRGANSAKTAGVSFGELTGMITGAQEATRLGGERIGTSMKTISANYLQLKNPTTAAQRKKTDLFKAHGIDITKAETLTDVLEEVNGIWGGLEDTEQNALVLALAGKEHSNVLTAIINEWETVKRASSDADFQLGLGEDGSAYKEFNEQKDSVRFQLAELENAWLQLMNTIGESDGLVKNVLEFLTNGIEKLNSLAGNDKLMEMLKLLLIGVGLHAGTNGLMRAMDILETGSRNMLGNVRDMVHLMRGNPHLMGSGRGDNPTGRRGRGGTSTDEERRRRTREQEERERQERENEERRRRYGQNHTEPSPHGDIGYRDEMYRRDADLPDGNGNANNGTLKRGAKTVLSMIPILGDALLIAELIGVDVFGTAGRLIDSLGSSTELYSKKTAEQLESLKLSNMMLNGDIQIYEEEASKGEYSWKNLTKEAIESGEGLSEEDFRAIKEAQNNRIKELGLDKFSDVDLEIKWNDSEMVLKQIKEYEKALERLKQHESKELAKDYTSILSETVKGEDKAKENIAEKEKKLEETKNELDMAKRKLAQAEEDMDFNNMEIQGRAVERLEGKYNKLKKSLEGSQDAVEEAKESYLKIGEALAKLDAKDVEEILGGIEGKEELALAVKFLGESYMTAVDESRQFDKALELNKKTTQLTHEEFAELLGILKLGTDEFNDTSYEDYIDENTKTREEIQAVIDTLIEEKEQAEITAQKAYEAGVLIAQGMGIGAKGATELVTATSLARKELDKLPTTKTVTIKVNEILNKNKVKQNQYNDFGQGDKLTPNVSTQPKTQGVVSASVSTTGKVSNATSTNATSTKAQTTTTKEVDNSKISQDVWRYWRTEDKQEKLAIIMSDLTRAIEEANGDSKKLANLYEKQLKNLSSQQSTASTLKKAKTNEAQIRLGELQKYGFKVDKKNLTISNLEQQSMKLTGDKATKAEELLNQWKTLVGEIRGLDDNIKNLKDEVKDVKVARELNKYATIFKQIEKSSKTIENKNSLNNSFLGLIDGADKELQLQTLSKVAYDSSDAMNRLLNSFNKLSVANITYAENGEALHSQLSTLKDQILSNADAVIEYNQQLNDLEFNRATEDISKFNEAVENLKSNLTDSRTNVQEGLLSGTGLEDLQSSKARVLDLSRRNKLDEMAQQRLTLEKNLQVALDGFATKNIEREVKVANETLKIKQNMYNELLQFESDYNDGKHVKQFSEIFASFNEATEDSNYNLDDNLTKFYTKLYNKQVELNEKFAKGLSSSVYEERLEAEYQYSLESLELENEINKERIALAKKSIEEYNRQLEDSSLTQTQSKSIISQIESEEDALISLQNSIKDNIQTLYDFQLSQIDNLISKYDEMASALEYSLSLLQAVRPKDLNSQYAVLESMKDNEVMRKSSLRDSIATLKQEMSLLEQGSFEWNILNSKVYDYNQQLLNVNKSILDMNNQIQSNQLTNIVGKFEKKLFGGKSSQQFKNYQDLWLTGLERELALEEMYKKISDLGTDTFNDKMALLEKQEKVSRLEADYLGKQMEIYELQKGLEDSKEQRNVRTLQQNSDGTFQWNYVADGENSDEQSIKIKQAQVELMKMENDAKDSYLGKLQEIVTGVQSGQFSTKEELKEELSNLESAYKVILGDVPATMKNLSSEIVYAYEQAKLGNEDLLNELLENGQSSPVITTITSLEKSIVKELTSLGDKVEKAIRDSLMKGNNYESGVFKSNNVSTIADSNKGTSIVIDKLEFPNATSSKEIQDALINLPQYAMQYAKSKK